MEKAAIVHIPENVFAYPVSEDTLNIRLKAKKGDIVHVDILYKNLYDHTEAFDIKKMDMILSDEETDLFETSIRVSEKHFKYYFRLTTKTQILNFTADGYIDIPSETNCFYYPMINPDDQLSLPKWAEGEIIYQLLVDRFLDGNSANNPANVKSVSELPDRNTYYGGDFEGIIQKLDYIKSYGAKVIYLSPVFKSPSYHKYDISDYYEIEAIYGGSTGLKKLVNYAHDAGMRIILDGVFNHCSYQNPLFQDLLTHQQKSRYCNWFEPYSFPVSIEKGNYNNFANLVPEMPRFNTANPEVIEYLSESALYWTKELGIDGWRLDVADEVSSAFWCRFHDKLKAFNPDLLIIGEIWSYAGRWTLGNQLDTVTNYKYRKWLLDFVANRIDSSTFFAKIAGIKMLYKTPVHNYLINLIGSHDTERAYRTIGNQKDFFLALGATLLLDGIPLIYYGDEYGMDGGVDPTNRRAMDWFQTKTAEAKWVSEVALFRSTSTTLKKGIIQPLESPARILAFKRTFQNETLEIFVNFSDQPYDSQWENGEVIFGNTTDSEGHIFINSKSLAIIHVN
ncbi:MAG: glycoside hydrolase family 13 protein [Candidatus Izemoplasmatales bacterium]|jgi:glycosidase